MSFIQSTVKCKNCNKKLNIAFGVVGIEIIADGGPRNCPECKKGDSLEFLCYGWEAD